LEQQEKDRFIAVIPARKGSKRLPGKNLKKLSGKPLILHTIQEAALCKSIDNIYVLTDSPEIAEVATENGAEVPYLRSRKTSSDKASMLSVLLEFVDFFDSRERQFENVILLQPTSPLRTAKQIDDACKLYERSLADTLVSVMFFPKFCMDGKLMSVRAGYLVPKTPPRTPSDQSETLVRNGPAILIEKFERLRDEKTLYGAKTIPFLMDFKSSIDIDDGDDFWLAEAIFEKNKS